eukprot:CAMPEP_0115269226 /NCGR_PEP_ID=MMETSP0270-20121206/52931_1 /TAXON_ID=71861 /ORGANISM="Scrippsiella trochoidea, Strain CCMP3099" /LENGTH=155 /DNA_ID=CAMNT_0002685461 /DNA_START=155 /DNA_END=622 /DNA_ORIENTATION=+
MNSTAVHIPESKQILADAEKDKSVDLASGFTKGRRCICLSESTGERTAAEYFVDDDLGQLVVKTAASAGWPKMVVCPVMSIADIYTIEDGEECFPRHIIELLTSQEKAGLFLIEHTTDGSSAELASIYLVEASQAALGDLLGRLRELAARVQIQG